MLLNVCERDKIDYNIVVNFLDNFNDKENFNRFFELCYNYSVGYLNYLKAKGYRISVDSGEQGHALNNLAWDILGSFFRSDKNRPFKIIFDNFPKNEIESYKETDSTELIDKFKFLLFGFIRQELSRMKKEADPQIENLKRRIKEILKQPQYIVTNAGNNYMEYICLAGDKTKSNRDCSVLEFDKLLVLVEDAYNVSSSRNEWVRNIFKILRSMTDVQFCLKKHELINAMVNINMKYVENGGLKPAILPGTDYHVHKNMIEEAQKQAILWLKTDILKNFIEKKRISLETSRLFVKAVGCYFRDLIYSSGVDSLPAYFREVMPESEHARYLQDYKYIFETCIYKAEENFRERIKKSIKPGFGDYNKSRGGK